LTPESGCCQ